MRRGWDSFTYDMYKRPDLVIARDGNRIFLHARVINRPHRILSWIDRNTAERTRVNLEFLAENNTILNLTDHWKNF